MGLLSRALGEAGGTLEDVTTAVASRMVLEWPGGVTRLPLPGFFCKHECLGSVHRLWVAELTCLIAIAAQASTKSSTHLPFTALHLLGLRRVGLLVHHHRAGPWGFLGSFI